MANLRPGQKPLVLPYYPHMLFEDVEVWTRFLQSDRGRILEVWYDVHVGQPVAVPEGSPEYMKLVALGVTRKRIDVVCRVAEGFWVVEVKPYANALALGQVLNYTRLFGIEYPAAVPARPVIVCDIADDDLRGDFSGRGVTLFETGYRVA